MRALPSTLLIGAMLAAGAAPARAQLRSDAAPLHIDADPPVDAPSRSAVPDATIVVRGAVPSSFQVVAALVPAALRATREVGYEISTSPGIRLLGARSGLLAVREANPKLLLTLQVPADAPAGESPAARIQFTAGGAAALVVVALEVPRQSKLSLGAARAIQGARPGQSLEVAFQLRNVGNAPDTVELAAEAPPDWTAVATRLPIVLQPSEIARPVLRVKVPEELSSGSGRITLVARSGGVERASHSVVVEVTPSRASEAAGPIATVRLLAVQEGAGAARPLPSLGFRGALAPNVRMDATFTPALTDRAAAVQTASMLGHSVAPDRLSLSGDSWAVALGTTGTATTPLTGQVIAGSGGMLQLGRDGRGVRLLAVRALESMDWRSRGPVRYAGGADWRQGAVTLSANATHLAEADTPARRLDALSVGARLVSGGLELSSELAGRRVDGGAGVGAAGELRYLREGTSIDARVLHAPGGGDGFAQAATGLFAAASQQFGDRWRLAGNGWHTADATATFSRIVSEGLAVSPALRVSRALTVGADARAFRLQSESAAGSFGAAQRQLGLSSGLRIGDLRLGADVMTTALSHDVAAPDGAVLSDRGRRMSARGNARYVSGLGSLGAALSFESASTTMPTQATFSLFAERLRPIRGWSGLSLDAQMHRVRLAGVTRSITRAALNLDLRGGTYASVAAHRDGFVRTPGDRPLTRFSLKLERSIALPMPMALRPSGVVYEDVNGNGRRDRGEPGIAGSLVRRGAESATSDQRGRFFFGSNVSAPVEVDAGSLPAGWLLSRAPGSNSRDIGVVPTAAVEVGARLSEEAPNLELGEVTVVLRDAGENEWIARTTAGGTAFFDALPLGRYRIEAFADEASEPIRFDALPALELSVPGQVARVVATAHRRRVKVFQAQPTMQTRPDAAGGSSR